MATYRRQYGLDSPSFTRAAKVCERVLRDGQFLTRRELAVHFAAADLPGDGGRMAHLAMYAELEGVICSGPRRGKQSTYALLAERAPAGVRLSRDEALRELARRFFRSHGPATLRDFVWWSGLTTAEARRGVELSRARKREVAGTAYWSLGRATAVRPRQPLVRLLPIYDEYLVAYRDRAAVPHGPSVIPSLTGGFVNFQHALVIAGQVAGTWRPVQNAKGVDVNVAPLRRLAPPERRAVEREVERYRRFVGGLPTVIAAGD
jgi:hypothetical protein